MKLSYLLPNATDYRSDYSAEEIEICGVCDNTEDMQNGDVFIAKRGKNFDPLHLLSKMEQCGISAIILEDGHNLPFVTDIPCFYIRDIEEGSAHIWSRYYRRPEKELSLIGITGTNGKTTTAAILSHLLNTSGEKCGYIGTLGVFSAAKERKDLKEGNMTTPSPKVLFKALRALCDDGCRYAVIEVSSHALIQKRVSPLCFRLSLFTNLSEDHLDYHKTMDAYFDAKALLFKQSAHALVNIDDPYGKVLYEKLSIPKSSLGILSEAAYSLTDLNESDPRGAQYTCCGENIYFPVRTNLCGVFNLYNSLAAISASIILGICPDEITKGLLTLPAVRGRMERLSLEKYAVPFSVIIDYAHTPDALKAVLSSARRFTRGRVIALFGAGGDREKEKRAKMGMIAESYADFIFVTTDNSRSETPLVIIRDILSGMAKEEKRRVICNRKTAIEEALSFAREGDTLLLLGKGHEKYIIDKNGESPFCERKIVEDFFEKRARTYDC